MSSINSGRRLALKQGLAIAAASAASGVMFSPRARAAGQIYHYKLGIALAPGHPTTANLTAAAAEIARVSNGRLNIQVFPNSQLGSDTDMISQVRSGAIDFVSTAGLIWGTLVPTASISGIGFAFPSYDHVWRAMDGELGAHIRAAFAKINLVPQARIWDHGFRQVTSSTRQIAMPQDFNGFKIRVPLSPALTSLFKAFGAAPAGINMAETYTALQTKIVDGQENPLTILETQKLYEVQKYCSLTSHVWDGFWLVGNMRTWNALPEDLRQIASTTFDAYAVKQRQAVDALNARLREQLKDRGMIFNQPDVKAFRDYLSKAGFYKDWKKKFPADTWTLLEKYSGQLA
ncbi:TRAP transporter substrate-binding protein [Burkholderia anthina]|uniref:TRAP dicarboxylate family transporter subunit DctP n=1 Tax=Burkholderia anthina TaxID=179879 RepID=A0A6P2GD07_9BURK|nr:TRAP transporter substrate-binding protein [Burkholderia anthina]MBM2771312.1 TRAP transporter substrate-binding protein [Burkholderia anthina]VVU51603.1 TRAP dicarboxylate family transporter subunit DctP [Burkholderia anthina]